MSRLDRFKQARAAVQSDAEQRYEARQSVRSRTRGLIAAEGPGAADTAERKASFNLRSAKRAQLKAIVGSALPFGMADVMSSLEPVRELKTVTDLYGV